MLGKVQDFLQESFETEIIDVLRSSVYPDGTP